MGLLEDMQAMAAQRAAAGPPTPPSAQDQQAMQAQKNAVALQQLSQQTAQAQPGPLHHMNIVGQFPTVQRGPVSPRKPLGAGQRPMRRI